MNELNVQDLTQFGEMLGASLQSPVVIELIGDVGAGKTTLTKSIAKGMGITQTVQSPSFTIYNYYRAPNEMELHHYDFYRISDPGLMSFELHESIHNSQAVTIIEWGKSVNALLPDNRLRIHIKASQEVSKRNIEIIGPLPAGLRQWVE
jgi:tRNA threonylcarbamoyladenosine biosynthesis protein TsaE